MEIIQPVCKNCGTVLDTINFTAEMTEQWTWNGDSWECLEFETSQVQLPLLNTSGYLQGTYANVYKMSGNRATYKSGDPNNFVHSPYTEDFDEVNVYYHITKFRQDFINNLYTPSFNQANVSIGWNLSERKSYYDPSFDIIYFNNGVPTDPNFSREANVIYHEFVHKVQLNRT
ncbi:MAG: hypothetical protein AB1432_12325 [Bacteroidota bacterium]